MCGIGGFLGDKPANIDKIKLLGIYNVTRGSDSCGIAINDKIVRGVKEEANFSTFIERNDLRTYESHTNYNILLHTRNASNKTTKDDIDCAHPFVIRNKKGKALLVGVHNGFISNEAEIAKKYNVKEERVDSKTIFSILAKAKQDPKYFDVLKDYEGAAVLCWYYLDEPNTMYLWKGGSKEYVNSTDFTEERPLFVYRPKDDNGKFKNEFYFSSIKESLYAIGGEPGFSKGHVDKSPTVYTIPMNSIVILKHNEKMEIRPINRTVTNNNHSYYGTTYTKSQSATTTTYTKKTESDCKEKLIATFKDYPVTKWKNVAIMGSNNIPTIDNEPFIFDQVKNGGKIYFYKGRYWRNGHMVGHNTKDYCVSLELDIDGFENNKADMRCDSTSVDTYYFFQGLLVLSEKHAKDLEAKVVAGRIYKGSDKRELELTEIKEYVYGFCHNFGDKYGNARMAGTHWATGLFYPMFDYDRVYEFSTGCFRGAKYEKVSPAKKLEILKKFEPSPVKTEASKVIVLPKSITKEIQEAADTINNVIDETILNHTHDIVSSCNSAMTKIEPYKEQKRYIGLYNIIKGMKNSIMHKLKSLEEGDQKEEFTLTNEESPLYS